MEIFFYNKSIWGFFLVRKSIRDIDFQLTLPNHKNHYLKNRTGRSLTKPNTREKKRSTTTRISKGSEQTEREKEGTTRCWLTTQTSEFLLEPEKAKTTPRGNSEPHLEPCKLLHRKATSRHHPGPKTTTTTRGEAKLGEVSQTKQANPHLRKTITTSPKGKTRTPNRQGKETKHDFTFGKHTTSVRTKSSTRTKLSHTPPNKSSREAHTPEAPI